MRSIVSLCSGVLVLLVSLAHGTPAAQYTLTDLGEALTVTSIDKQGQTVLATRLVNGQQVSVLLTAIADALGLLPDGVFLIGQGIDRGRVTGQASTGASGLFTHAFLFTLDEGLRDLGTLGGPELTSVGTDLNPTDIVGYGTDPATNMVIVPLRFPGGGPAQTLATLGGQSGFANALNDLGDIVGATRTASNDLHATLWPHAALTTPQDLQTLSGATLSFATDVNEALQAVGDVADAQGRFQGFVWAQTTGMLVLPPLPQHLASSTRSINNAGDMVGSSDSGEDFHATIWGSNRVPIKLQDRLVDAQGFHLDRAMGINEAGQIAGLARKAGITHAVRLTPVP